MQHSCANLRGVSLQRRHSQPHYTPAALQAEAKSLRLKAQLYRKKASPNAFSSHRDTRSAKLHRRTTTCSATSTAIGVGIFFTPSIVAVIYAYFKGKGNVKDGLSRLLTEVTQGYFQPNVGGESIPVAQGELSDLAGDEPLFKALYQWYACRMLCLTGQLACTHFMLTFLHMSEQLRVHHFAVTHTKKQRNRGEARTATSHPSYHCTFSAASTVDFCSTPCSDSRLLLVAGSWTAEVCTS